MKKTLSIGTCLIFVVLFWACERPKSPDFQLNHKIQAPLSIQKTYTFLGENDALIDTTGEDFEDIFTTDEDGLVRITKEQDFDFGDLNDAIPEVDVASTTVNSQVGEIELTSFSSSGNVGSASFEEVTGFSGLSEGDQIPAGSTPGTINIDISTDFFQSALISDGGDLKITMTNNLAFDADQLTLTLNSGSTVVGSTTIGTANDPQDNFEHNTTETGVITIPASTQLSDLSVDINTSWDQQTLQDDPQNLIVNDIAGESLTASQLTAAPESQSFNSSGNSSIDESNFEFRSAGDYVELDGGELSIDITTGIDVSVTDLTITFQGIQDANGNNYVLNVTESGVIPRSSTNGGQFSKTESLAGFRITSNNISYTIESTTENVQDNFDPNTDAYRTISAVDELDAEIGFNNLQIGEAKGYVVPQQILLNEDVTNDGIENLDVFNDNEAEITSIDGISDISSRISDITFANPILSAIYNTNLGLNTTIYAAIAGTNENGKTIYLRGNNGTDYDVATNEIPPELQANGAPLGADDLIKFPIDTAETPNAQQGEMGSNVFSSSNTNSSEFFSNLPTNIRFIGVAQINENQNSGIVLNPVIFDPKLSVELPFDFSADNATFKDTLDADLSDLPGKNDDSSLSEGTLTINYTNGLPLSLDLNLHLVDKNGDPVVSKDNIAIEAGTTNSEGFVEEGGGAQNKAQISFTKQELQKLNQTRNIQMNISINMPQQQAVKLSKDDSITIKVNMEVAFTSTVN